MKPVVLSLLAVGALSACVSTTTIPDSGRGVGLGADPFADQRAVRDARLGGAEPIIELEASGRPSTLEDRGQLPAVTTAPLPATGATTTAVATGPAAPPLAPSAPRPVGISDEQSFEAVSSRESIESDAARLERLRNEYQVVQPTALPTRSRTAGPNIVQYALQTRNTKGVQIYRRSPLAREAKQARNCAKFQSDDAAQREFLARGGPRRDRLGLDQDGDGFACDWDPAVYRVAGN